MFDLIKICEFLFWFLNKLACEVVTFLGDTVMVCFNGWPILLTDLCWDFYF